jgi:hypothetical protein
MVEIQVRKAEPESARAKSTGLDVNALVVKIRDFVDSIRMLAPSGEPMSVKVEGFSFSVGSKDGGADLFLKLNLSIKPKPTEPLVLPSDKCSCL